MDPAQAAQAIEVAKPLFLALKNGTATQADKDQLLLILCKVVLS